MTAIDFRKLLKQAKKEAQQQYKSETDGKDETTTATRIQHDERIGLDGPSQSHSSITTTTTSIDWDSRNDPSLQFQQQLRTPFSFVLRESSSQGQPIDITSFYSSIQYFPPLSTETTTTKDLQPLVQWLQALPHGDSGQGEWKTMTYGKRKVCMFDGTTPSHSSSSSTSASLLPPPLSILAHQLVQAGIFSTDTPPNHVLLNEYQPGQGIYPHTDGPAYESITATLSLESSVLLEFTPRWKTYETHHNALLSTPQSPPPNAMGDGCRGEGCSVWLEAGSWIVFSKVAYIDYCHGIAFSHYDVLDDHPDCLNVGCSAAVSSIAGSCIPRKHRYSLTFRHRKVIP